MNRRPTLPSATRRIAFTLVELLTVIAIISLLIGILIPSLSKARDQAKNAKTKAALKSIGDGLELFRNELESEFRGYPPSRTTNTTDPSFNRDDPTESGNQHISGAQLLVRYLMGKDFNGYVSRRSVPRAMIDAAVTGYEQRDWYVTTPTGYNTIGALPRSGPYLPAEGIRTAQPKDVPGAPIPPTNTADVRADDRTMEQPVMLDTFEYPILYYSANTQRSADASAPMARFDEASGVKGIYQFKDNGLWTGLCLGTRTGAICTTPWWDFGAGKHHISNFGPTDPPDRTNVADDNETFCYYVMNRNAYETTNEQTVTPVKKDSFILISAGRDGLYGTRDDVTNFQ
ncbi:MAG: type II secretion system protein [Phycisphaerae bacterium]